MAKPNLNTTLFIKPEYIPTTITLQDAEYIRSGRWICKESPTGAHHWKEVPEVERGIFVCIYCWENKRFPTTYNHI